MAWGPILVNDKIPLNHRVLYIELEDIFGISLFRICGFIRRKGGCMLTLSDL